MSKKKCHCDDGPTDMEGVTYQYPKIKPLFKTLPLEEKKKPPPKKKKAPPPKKRW